MASGKGELLWSGTGNPHYHVGLLSGIIVTALVAVRLRLVASGLAGFALVVLGSLLVAELVLIATTVEFERFPGVLDAAVPLVLLAAAGVLYVLGVLTLVAGGAGSLEILVGSALGVAGGGVVVWLDEGLAERPLLAVFLSAFVAVGVVGLDVFAALHMLRVRSGGTLATVVGAGHLGALVAISVYTADRLWHHGLRGVFPGLGRRLRE